MLVYPQLATGALSQFPARKQRHMRTIANTFGDSSKIKLADPHGAVTEWRLNYTGLSDAEASNLAQFFAATEGSLNVFTFLDPLGNLLAWSDHLDNQVWSVAPYLSLTGGLADPRGGTSAWQLSNSGGGPQGITQTLSAPGGYLYSFSVYAKATQPGTVTLLKGASRSDCNLGTDWGRLTFSGQGDASADSIAFGLEVPAGTLVEVYGFQVEAQAASSEYKPSKTGGVYENASFRDDVLSFAATDVNQNSATVTITHANG